MPLTSRTVIAVFDDYATADKAVTDLIRSGFSRENIEIASNDRYITDSAVGNAGLSGRGPADSGGGGIGGFLRRMFGVADDTADHYDEAIRRGGAVVSVETDDEDRAADILDRNGAVDIDERASSWRQELPETSSDEAVIGRNNVAERSIPVVREELHVGKRDVLRGGARVFNRITEQPVEEQVQLREEHVRVDRRPVNRPATEADFRAQDEVIELTEMAEEPVVAKTARVVEEVVLGKETTQRTETVRDTVRRTEVNVENLRNDQRSWTDYDEDFRKDFQSRYGSASGERYETHAPAYQYGYGLASDERYRGRSWDEVESAVRSDYERQYPGGTWEQMKDSIRYGWKKVTGRA